MSHFDLVVFVYCRDLRGRNIKEYVEETYPPFMQVRQVVMNMKTGAVECGEGIFFQGWSSGEG